MFRRKVLLPLIGLTATFAAILFAQRFGEDVPTAGGTKTGQGVPLWVSRPDPGSGIKAEDTTPGMFAAELRRFYGIEGIDSDGRTQTVVIIVAFHHPTLASDFLVACRRHGLPASDLQQVSAIDGQIPPTNAGWSWEAALDVLTVHAVAPGAKKLVIEAMSDSSADLTAAIQKAIAIASVQGRENCRTFSMSWGRAESRVDLATNALFNRPGFTFIAASGDSGAGSLWPAMSPYVVSAGGTTPVVDGSGKRVAETGWSGSGGGQSFVQARPSYQSPFVRNTLKRSGPDIAGLANPYPGFSVFNSSQGGWKVIGGTSWSAPFVAGLVTLANDKCFRSGRPPVGTGYVYGTPELLYKIAGRSAYTNPLHALFDISSGNNGISAGPGFDSVTGLGTPNAPLFVNALVVN